jgi:Uma2 family endonuclease
MSTTTKPTAPEEIEYPDSDGEPMAENTVQFDWIMMIKGGLDILFRDAPDVFVAGDLLWYPVEGDNTTRMAPDAMVAFGRPKGPRGSYMQWREGGIAPHVAFEILSPGNRAGELARKFQFYQRFGVEESYIYDPDDNTLEGWLRDGETLRKVPEMNGWVSPRLGVRFELVQDEFRLIGPDGKPFVSNVELSRRFDEQAQQIERLAAQLRALGFEPEG